MEKAWGASLKGRSDTSSGSESDLTSTCNSESGSDICLQRIFSWRNCLLCLCQLLHLRLQWSRLFRDKFQLTFEQKSLRPHRNFNLVHLQRMVAYIMFWFCSKKTWQKSQFSLYLVTRNRCNRQLVCHFAWMISSFYWTVISPQHFRFWVARITTQEKKC